jgi:CBS domain-containing protein
VARPDPPPDPPPKEADMKISEIMTRDVEVAAPGDTLRSAAQLMADLDVGVLPVTDDGQLVGMITDRDITVRAVAEGKDPRTTRVREVMTEEVIYGFEDQEIDDAIRVMEQKQIRRLLVMNRDKRLVGIVSLGDLATESGDARKSGEVLQDVSEPSQPQR